jgi:hypothetical protein
MGILLQSALIDKWDQPWRIYIISVDWVSVFEHTSLLLAMNILKNLHASLVLVLGSKADYWLEWSKYIYLELRFA